MCAMCAGVTHGGLLLVMYSALLKNLAYSVTDYMPRLQKGFVSRCF
jgi:hypothetical protein